MTTEVVDRVLRSSRYRDVDRDLIDRLATEELARSRNVDDAVKRVKRRLHQAVGAFRDATRGGRLAESWSGELGDPAFRAACEEAMREHASTRERVPLLDGFHARIWGHTGLPTRVLDVGCGLAPLALPWMDIGAARYIATDVDRRALGVVDRFLTLVGQPHEARVADAVTHPPTDEAEVALLLKLVPTLDRQDRAAAARLLSALRTRHAVVSFPARSLGGRAHGMEATYRRRLDLLVSEAGRVAAVAEASVPNELVFVLTLDG